MLNLSHLYSKFELFCNFWWLAILMVSCGTAIRTMKYVMIYADMCPRFCFCVKAVPDKDTTVLHALSHYDMLLVLTHSVAFIDGYWRAHVRGPVWEITGTRGQSEEETEGRTKEYMGAVTVAVKSLTHHDMDQSHLGLYWDKGRTDSNTVMGYWADRPKQGIWEFLQCENLINLSEIKSKTLAFLHFVAHKLMSILLK